MNNKQITNKALKELEKLGFKVFNMSFDRRMPPGMIGFPDHNIISKNGFVFYIEDKFGSDKLSDEQVIVRNTIEQCARHSYGVVGYYINTGNIQEIVDDIIKSIEWKP